MDVFIIHEQGLIANTYSESNKRSSRGCKIAAFGIGRHSKLSVTVAAFYFARLNSSRSYHHFDHIKVMIRPSAFLLFSNNWVGRLARVRPYEDCPLHRSQVQLMGSRQLVLGTKSEFSYPKDRGISFCFAVSSTIWVKIKKEVSL